MWENKQALMFTQWILPKICPCRSVFNFFLPICPRVHKLWKKLRTTLSALIYHLSTYTLLSVRHHHPLIMTNRKCVRKWEFFKGHKSLSSHHENVKSLKVDVTSFIITLTSPRVLVLQRMQENSITVFCGWECECA